MCIMTAVNSLELGSLLGMAFRGIDASYSFAILIPPLLQIQAV